MFFLPLRATRAAKAASDVLRVLKKFERFLKSDLTKLLLKN